jgi:hypothetical protein
VPALRPAQAFSIANATKWLAGMKHNRGTAVNILIGAPVWAWPLFFVLVALGLRSTRPRELSRSAVFVWPAILTVLSIYSVATSYGARPLALGGWLAGMASGIIVGGMTPIGRRNARFDKMSGKFYVSGSWTPLVLLMAVFWSRFAIGVARARVPQAVDTSLFQIGTSLALGLCSGLFTARTISLMFLRSASPRDAGDLP